MALHIKSTTKFKILIGSSALAVSAVAALFSVKGVSSLFSGAFFTIIIMMSILEIAKIVVASYVARFWNVISTTIKTYFITAILILMTITSAGIFGYLSEAYQGTKSNYTINETQIQLLQLKKTQFENKKLRLQSSLDAALQEKRSNTDIISQSKKDSLTSWQRSMIASTNKSKDKLENKISVLETQMSNSDDSIFYYQNKIDEINSINVKGELGPLKFIADAFRTDMDTVVKYLIFMLIFVFDPLAILLFTSLSIMIRKEEEKEISNSILKPNEHIIDSINNDAHKTHENLNKNETIENNIDEMSDIKVTQNNIMQQQIELPQEETPIQDDNSPVVWRTANWKPPHK